MTRSRAAQTKRKTRIQIEKEELILEAALEVFSAHGFRGATIDQIADEAGMSKPNLLYYFQTKEAIHRVVIDRLLDVWLDPLRRLDESGNPLDEICGYIRRKLGMARELPRESRLFANEILQGAPRIPSELRDLKELVDEKAAVISGWIAAGKIANVDPYHLIFSIWATTQHYADFDVQVKTILAAPEAVDARFERAEEFLVSLFTNGLTRHD